MPQKELLIPNLLEGVRYDVDPTQVDPTQLSDSANFSTRFTPPINSANSLLNIQKRGLSVRGTARQLTTAEVSHSSVAGTELDPSIMEEVTIFDSSGNDSNKDILQLSAIPGQDTVYLHSVRVPSRGTQGTESQRIYRSATPTAMGTADTVRFFGDIKSVPGRKIIATGYWEVQSGTGTSASFSTIIDQDFDVAGNVNLTASGSTVTGSGTAFTSLTSNSYIQFQTGGVWDTAGGAIFSPTGWYRITGVASDTSLTIDPAWDGVSETAVSYRAMVASDYAPLSLTNITAVGSHKFRTFLGTFQNNTSFLYVSDAGDPTSIQAANVFRIGDQGEKILQLIDNNDYVMVVKEHSIYAFYLASSTVTDSNIYVIHQSIGGMNNKSAILTPFGVGILTQQDGLYILRKNSLDPICPQLRAKLKILDNTIDRSVLGYGDGRLLVGIPQIDGSSTASVFSYDLVTGSLDRHNYGMSLSSEDLFEELTLLPGTQTNYNRPKMCLGKSLIYELDHFEDATSPSSTYLESSVTASCITKEFTLGEDKFEGIGRYLIVEFNAPNTTDVLTITPYFDGSSRPDVTFTPTSTGFNILKADLGQVTNDYRGKKVKFELQYTHSLEFNSQVFTFYLLRFLYDVQPRIE